MSTTTTTTTTTTASTTATSALNEIEAVVFSSDLLCYYDSPCQQRLVVSYEDMDDLTNKLNDIYHTPTVSGSVDDRDQDTIESYSMTSSSKSLLSEYSAMASPLDSCFDESEEYDEQSDEEDEMAVNRSQNGSRSGSASDSRGLGLPDFSQFESTKASIMTIPYPPATPAEPSTGMDESMEKRKSRFRHRRWERFGKWKNSFRRRRSASGDTSERVRQ